MHDGRPGSQAERPGHPGTGREAPAVEDLDPHRDAPSAQVICEARQQVDLFLDLAAADERAFALLADDEPGISEVSSRACRTGAMLTPKAFAYSSSVGRRGARHQHARGDLVLDRATDLEVERDRTRAADVGGHDDIFL